MSINCFTKLSIKPFKSGRVTSLAKSNVLTGGRLPSVAPILPPVRDSRVDAYAGVGDSWGQSERVCLLSALGTEPNIRRKIGRSRYGRVVVFEMVGKALTSRFAGRCMM